MRTIIVLAVASVSLVPAQAGSRPVAETVRRLVEVCVNKYPRSNTDDCVDAQIMAAKKVIGQFKTINRKPGHRIIAGVCTIDNTHFGLYDWVGINQCLKKNGVSK